MSKQFSKEQEQFLHHIVDAVPALVAVYNINTGDYLYVSKAIKRLLGYSDDEFIKGGFPFIASLVHPDDMPRIMEENNTALQRANKTKHTPDTEPIVNFEYRMKHKDGTWRWLHTDGSVFGRSANGKVDHVLNVSFDITARKQAEMQLEQLRKRDKIQAQEALRKSEKLFRTLTTHAPVGIFLTDINGDCEFVNDKWCEIAGMTSEEARGKGWERALYPGDKDRVSQEWYDAAINKRVFESEYRFITPEGKVTWLYGSAVILENDGHAAGYLGIILDITDRKMAEEKIRQSEQQLQAIMDESPAVIFLKDLEGKYRLINRKFEQLFGITRDEACGKTDYEMFPKETADHVTKNDKEVIQTGKSLEIEEVVPHVDGPHTYISVKFPLFDPAGQPYAVCGIATDITERKAIEERKEDFINVASHELKTPVTSVKIFAQVLKNHSEKIRDQKALDVLSKMDRQLNKQTMLIGDLLNLSKIQTGRFDFRKELFKLDDLIRETVESLQGSIGNHKIVIDGQTEKKLFADRDRVGQVLINLLTNAVKYSPEADKIIVHSEKKKDHVEVAVQDFGIGIPKEAQEKVFERFFRVEGEDENTYPGFGIGLYVSSEIIKRHAGKIWVESKQGKGSTFYFSIPLPKKGSNRYSKALEK